jgi:hypothetical protein
MRFKRWLGAAVAVGVLTAAAPAQAQTPSPTACPALFHVLHPDTVGDLVLAEGRYRITTFGTGRPTCSQASDLLRQFLEDWDGRLQRPWVVDTELNGFTRGADSTTGFSLALVAPDVPDSGGGGRYPATGAACPGFFQVLHDDRIGTFVIPTGYYRITVLGVGRLTCAGASTLLGEFLRDYDGVLQDGWELDPVNATFFRDNTHNSGFRLKPATPDEARNADRGTHPAGGSRRCPATFRVRNNDRIGRLRLRAGSYAITTSRLNCTAASSMFTQFLDDTDGVLPRPWRVDPDEGAFWRGQGTSIGFRVKRVRA